MQNIMLYFAFHWKQLIISYCIVSSTGFSLLLAEFPHDGQRPKQDIDAGQTKLWRGRRKRWSPRWERLPLLSLWMLLGAIGGSRGVCVDVDF